ncbi:MAG: class I SAM-dependent methyltransferase [Chloroflexi bacterium HGW-Chloroflexi-10]|nr:MAG: class I SAM-dependent methyltransferase [Chloroflexi bacterium HGW-Chloroflexi-10]
MSLFDFFSKKSDRYAASRPQYPDALYTYLVSQCTEREQVWDCGTGNGQAAISLSKHFKQVYATDLSEQQILNAFQGPNIHYSVQPAEETHFADAAFDAITVAQALHWFNHARFWTEVNRVLKPGGLFAAWGYDFSSITPQIDAMVKELILDVIAPYWSPRVQLLWNGYRDIEFPFKRIETPAFQITNKWNLYAYLEYIHTWSATRECIEQQGKTFFEQAARKLEDCWGYPNLPRPVIMPLTLLVGRK